mgnify:CR=1 FL=1
MRCSFLGPVALHMRSGRIHEAGRSVPGISERQQLLGHPVGQSVEKIIRGRSKGIDLDYFAGWVVPTIELGRHQPNQDSPSLVSFHRDPATGRLEATGHKVRSPSPALIYFPDFIAEA